MRLSWDFRITGYAGHKHPNKAPFGTQLMITTHKGESSAAMEIEVWQNRMRRGEVSYVELIDLRPGGCLTNCRVTEDTKIPWSWEK